jgi:hypothetical protein
LYGAIGEIIGYPMVIGGMAIIAAAGLVLGLWVFPETDLGTKVEQEEDREEMVLSGRDAE